MHAHAGAPLRCRRLLAPSAGGAAAGGGESVTTRVELDDMTSCVTTGGMPANSLQAAGSAMDVAPILLIFLVARCGFAAGMSTTGLK
ncbi:hypothetical protein ACWGDT_12015 [Streptomyces avermitilis]